jgi:hypothetical protein
MYIVVAQKVTYKELQVINLKNGISQNPNSINIITRLFLISQ